MERHADALADKKTRKKKTVHYRRYSLEKKGNDWASIGYQSTAAQVA